MASSKKVEYFDGKGDVNSFLVKARLYNKLKKYEGEDAAVSLASRLQEPAFNVYLRMSDEDKKDVEKIEAELKKQYQVGNRDREEALHLLSAVHRKEDETAQDLSYRITELVKLAYPSFTVAAKAVHVKDAFINAVHPDMRKELKTLSNFATIDIDGLLDNTVRLEVAGVKSFYKPMKAEMNFVAQGDDTSETERNFNDRLGGLEEAIAKLTVASTNSWNNRGSQPHRGRNRENRFAGNRTNKCWNCGDPSHILRQCPKRFCQCCGGQGHDIWQNGGCPKKSS